MAQVFISYKSEDRGAVEDLFTGLRAEGIDVWWDQGIAPTAEWRAEIHRQLAAAAIVVVVWSYTSTDLDGGKWVIQEAEDADRRKALVPICIDDVQPPLGLRHVQTADLIDWRGDRADPRWIGFVEIIRAKLEGRAVDATIARNEGPRTLASTVRGRGALLLLAAGLVAFIAASSIAFGVLVTSALVGGFVVAYFVLNLLFGRRRDDRAAATFVRRAFAVGWVTAFANVLVWTAAFGAAGWPFARPLVYPEFSIAVFDELRRPVPEAEVSVTIGGRVSRVALGADGTGHMTYPRYWGAQEGSVRVQNRSFNSETVIRRREGQFGDLVLGVASGAERLRVSHVTLRELAIDAALQGRLPRNLSTVFPNVIGVVRNSVWRETDAFLNMFDEVQLGSSYRGTHLAGAGQAQTVEAVNANDFASLRWPSVGPSGDTQYEAILAANFENGVYGCAPTLALDENYRMIVGSDEEYYNNDLLIPTPQSVAALSRSGFMRFADQEGRLAGDVWRLVDHRWLEAARTADAALTLPNEAERRLQEEYDEAAESGQVPRRKPSRDLYIHFLIEHHAPRGLLVAILKLTPKSSCGEMIPSATVFVPPPELRVSLIQNVSDVPLPIGQIVQGTITHNDIAYWEPGQTARAEEVSAWPGGLLAPGQTIIVPRRLVLPGAMTPGEVDQFVARAQGESIGFTTASPDYTGNQPNSARGITIHARQIAAAGSEVGFTPVHNRTWDYGDAGSTRGDTHAPYVVGTSVEGLAVTLNGITFQLREDRGVTVAMLGACECGSCPFVYASEPQSSRMLNRGPIITDLIGRRSESTQRLYLGVAVERVEIREVEPEVSHLDRVRLIVERVSGARRVYLPATEELRRADGRRLSLRQGERLVLSFPRYHRTLRDRRVYLEATGYYTPLSMPRRAAITQLRLRRSVVRRGATGE